MPASGVRARAAAKGTAKLAAALGEFYVALLAGKDDGKIATLRNQVVELSNDDNVQLDDELEATGGGLPVGGWSDVEAIYGEPDCGLSGESCGSGG